LFKTADETFLNCLLVPFIKIVLARILILHLLCKHMIKDTIPIIDTVGELLGALDGKDDIG